jgi:hypothetical protein
MENELNELKQQVEKLEKNIDIFIKTINNINLINMKLEEMIFKIKYKNTIYLKEGMYI